jgi:hypothetical protein
MMDIVSQDADIGLYDTQTERAKNLLSVQLGALEYAPEIGIDLEYFLGEDVKFQNESFQSYLIQNLANQGINVASLITNEENLFQQYTFNLSPAETDTGLIAR